MSRDGQGSVEVLTPTLAGMPWHARARVAAQRVGLDPRYARRWRWITKAAESGYARAKQMLPQIATMKTRLKAKREDSATLDQDRKAAESGDAKAQFTMAIRYEEGRGVDHDTARVIEWLRKSAEAGNRDAQGYLGIVYERGRGVTQDDQEALRWYLKAAEQGVAQSQYNLGVLYLNGQGSIRKDKDEAKKWFERARIHFSAGLGKGIGEPVFFGLPLASSALGGTSLDCA